MIKKYRKKPVEIEAVQWTGDNLAELRKMDGFNSVHTCFGGRLSIKTLEGMMFASVGDYIIKGVQGEFYPCKPDIFEQTYDIVSDAPTIEPERKKGKWIRNDNGTYSCSVCQSWIPEEQHYYARYCLYCGTDMRGEQDE